MSKKGRKPAPALRPNTQPTSVTNPAEAKKPTTATDFLSAWWLYAAIAALCFALYGNTLSNGYVMDDGAVITDNVTTKKGFSAIPELFQQSSVFGATKENYGTYRPLTMSIFAAEVGFFGESAKAQHFMHVLFYALLCLVLYKALRLLLQNYNPWIALVAVILFAVHPLHTEVAANIKSRDEILSLGLALGSLYFLLKQIDFGKGALWAYILFFAALLTKESAITFLAVLPLSLYFFRDISVGRIVKLCLPLLLPAAIYLLMRNAVLENIPTEIAVINNSLAEAQTFAERLPTVLYILLRYIGLLFYPHPLTWEYGFNQIPLKFWADPLVLVSLAVHLFLAVAAIVLFFRRSIFSWCILFYYITLSTSANVVILIAATMGERFVFTPSLGFCVAAAAGLVAITGGIYKADFFKVKKPVLLGIITVIVVVSGIKVHARNKEWESNLTLFAAGVKVSPNSYRANSAFAFETLKAGERATDPAQKQEHFSQAKEHYHKAVSIYPEMGSDWYNLSVAYSYLGEKERSFLALQRSFEKNPNFFNTAYNLGTIYMQRQDYPNMLKYFKRASEIDPTFGDVLFKTGVAHHYLNQLPEAINYYEQHLKKEPKSREAITNLQVAYQSLGNTERAQFYANLLSDM